MSIGVPHPPFLVKDEIHASPPPMAARIGFRMLHRRAPARSMSDDTAFAVVLHRYLPDGRERKLGDLAPELCTA
jgi:hypothetical protein